MKILGVCASPRRGQTTFKTLSAALEAAGRAAPGLIVEGVELAGLGRRVAEVAARLHGGK